jgi:hypothetical protein
MRRLAICVLLLILSLQATGAIGQIQPELKVSGTFRPSSPPEQPVRRKVGSGCVVELVQAYDLEGALVGKMEINFRIFVSGDCTKAPGTYDEHWISYGTYAVRVGDAEYTGELTYLATVRAGGKVQGTLTLDGELSAELKVSGNLDDGFMSYAGSQIGSRDR